MSAADDGARSKPIEAGIGVGIRPGAQIVDGELATERTIALLTGTAFHQPATTDAP